MGSGSDLLIFTSKQLPRFKRWRHAIKYLFVKRPHKIGGHPAVTRSLIAGLRSASHVDWLYSDHFQRRRTRTIHAVSGPDTVRDAIKAKKDGLCERLIVGPNIVVRGNDENSVLAAPEIDAVLVPCEWCRELLEADEPRLKGRVLIWPAGVDADYWKPSGRPRHKILVYEKNSPDAAGTAFTEIQAAGFDASVIRYGSYGPEEFKRNLDEAVACVVVGSSESQGLAIAEAWSMDVPTFVRRFDYSPLFEAPCSAAPYLNSATGAFWSSSEDLQELLTFKSSYQPREWVLDNCTDRHAAEALLRIAFPTSDVVDPYSFGADKPQS